MTPPFRSFIQSKRAQIRCGVTFCRRTLIYRITGTHSRLIFNTKMHCIRNLHISWIVPPDDLQMIGHSLMKCSRRKRFFLSYYRKCSIFNVFWFFFLYKLTMAHGNYGAHENQENFSFPQWLSLDQWVTVFSVHTSNSIEKNKEICIFLERTQYFSLIWFVQRAFTHFPLNLL